MTLSNVEDIYPLAPMQQGMLFHHVHDGLPEMYFVQLGCHVQGELDVAAFRQAWESVIQRHAVLRTSFMWEGMEQPVQVVRKNVDLPWREEDWSALSQAEQREKWRELLREDRQNGFDLGRAPLLRLALARGANHDFYFGWSYHHILLDGWSQQTILQEVFTVYEAARAGRPSPLKAPARYREYIRWLQKQDERTVESFWRNELEGFATPSYLSPAKNSPENKDTKPEYAAEGVLVEPGLSSALEQFARSQQVTLNTVVQGAWAILLSGYTGRQDVLFGATVSGRGVEVPQIDSIVGLFINTLPVRVRVNKDARIADFLKSLQGRQAEGRNYEFSPLVKVQGCASVKGGKPLFDHLVAFENYPVDAAMNARIGASVQIGATEMFEVTSYPLALIVSPGSQLGFRCIYDRNQFSRERITAILADLQSLLGKMAAGPNLSLEETGFLAHGQELITNPDAKPLEPAASVALRQETGSLPSAGCNQEEELLCGIFEQVLKKESVGLDANFFDLGGQSLKVIQVISRIRDIFGVKLPYRAVFEAPSPRGLSERVKQARSSGQKKAPSLARADRGASLPLSYAQHRLWFIDRLEPQSAAYNVSLALRFFGILDRAALQKSVDEIVCRHEVLRTRFLERDGVPVQEITQHSSLSVEMVDLRKFGIAERENEVRRRTEAETKMPFDLERGPLLRMKLLQTGEQEHVLLLSMHHIVSDEWSLGIMVEEFTALYAAYAAGRESPLPELELQYGDYSVWQREWMQGEVRNEQLEYWRKQLAGLKPLNLASGLSPAVRSHHGTWKMFELPEDVASEIKALALREGVTLYMMLLAVLQVLLHKRTGVLDVAVGGLTANRTRTETEALIGYFVNTVVLRADLGGNPGFLEVLKRVRSATLGAFEYQDLPFEMLVKELQPERQAGANPFVEVMFSLQNAGGKARSLPNLQVVQERELAQNNTAKFGLFLQMWNGGKGLTGGWNYATDLFGPETMEELTEQFIRLATQITHDPDTPLANLKVLSEEEIRLREQQVEVDELVMGNFSF